MALILIVVIHKPFILAGCAVIRPWEAIIVGATGGIISILGTMMFDQMKIDDPVGAISVHGLAGIWVSGIHGVGQEIYCI